MIKPSTALFARGSGALPSFYFRPTNYFPADQLLSGRPPPLACSAADALADMCPDLTFAEALSVLVLAPIANLCIFSLPVVNFFTIPVRPIMPPHPKP